MKDVKNTDGRCADDVFDVWFSDFTKPLLYCAIGYSDLVFVHDTGTPLTFM